MQTEELKKLDKQAIEAWNAHKKDKWMELCTNDVVWREPGLPQPIKGRDSVGQMFDGWHQAFPDFRLNVKNRVFGEDTVAAEYEFTGTNTGPLQMDPTAPPVPPTGKKIRIQATYFTKLKGGRVAEVHNYPDTAGMMQQLGLEGPVG